eukprot:scaffold166225_cov35-Tisochrysis_lutea.AAC.1
MGGSASKPDEEVAAESGGGFSVRMTPALLERAADSPVASQQLVTATRAEIETQLQLAFEQGAEYALAALKQQQASGGGAPPHPTSSQPTGLRPPSILPPYLEAYTHARPDTAHIFVLQYMKARKGRERARRGGISAPGTSNREWPSQVEERTRELEAQIVNAREETALREAEIATKVEALHEREYR